MSFVAETRVKKGHLELDDVPFSDDTEVKVIVIPKGDVKDEIDEFFSQYHFDVRQLKFHKEEANER